MQICSLLSAQKDAGVGDEAEKPDLVITDFNQFIDWLDAENPAMAPRK